jgi:hypothetical protein
MESRHSCRPEDLMNLTAENAESGYQKPKDRATFPARGKSRPSSGSAKPLSGIQPS